VHDGSDEQRKGLRRLQSLSDRRSEHHVSHVRQHVRSVRGCVVRVANSGVVAVAIRDSAPVKSGGLGKGRAASLLGLDGDDESVKDFQRNVKHVEEVVLLK
jgi:hypothetical protein